MRKKDEQSKMLKEVSIVRYVGVQMGQASSHLTVIYNYHSLESFGALIFVTYKN